MLLTLAAAVAAAVAAADDLRFSFFVDGVYRCLLHRSTAAFIGVVVVVVGVFVVAVAVSLLWLLSLLLWSYFLKW